VLDIGAGDAGAVRCRFVDVHNLLGGANPGNEKGTTGRVAGGAFYLPLPDAMPLWHPPNAEMFASCFG
jgi:hypothetical protein